MSIDEKREKHNIGEKLSKLYKTCKMNSLQTLLRQKKKELEVQQYKVAEAFDAPLFDSHTNASPWTSQQHVSDAIKKAEIIREEIKIIESYLGPSAYSFGIKKSVKKKKVKKSVKKSPKKKAKKSPKKKAKKSPKKKNC
jgi:hypothetical protein